MNPNEAFLRRKKTYKSPGSSITWIVLDKITAGSHLHMLCSDRDDPDDYAVFSFLLSVKDIKRHIPSDKFTCGEVSAREMFQEIVTRSLNGETV